VGLERNNFDPDVVRELKRAYRLLFASKLNISQAREQAQRELHPYPEVVDFLAFFERSDRGTIV
jgi:UDP-N-acetylglucosamine acyltransferase